jgi:Tfp pilus assembly PilM family ATPase/Tfp pilus assembly protein PilN
VSRAGKTFCIEKIFEAQPRPNADSVSDVLRTLISEHGFDRRAAVAVSMPNDAVFFRRTETDAVGLEHIRESGYSALDYDFPVEADKIVAQPCSYHQTKDRQYSVLTAAVARESLYQTRDVLLEARMSPDLVGAKIFAIHSTIMLNHPEIRTGMAIIVHIAESYLTLAVTENNEILVVRHFPIIGGCESNGRPVEDQVREVVLREANVTWQKLFETDIAPETRVCLVGPGEYIAALKEPIEEDLHCQTIVVDPYERVLMKQASRPQADISVAEGLALRTLAPEYASGINFLEADSAGAKSAVSHKRELIICAVLVVAIAAVSLIGLFVRKSQLEAEYARLKEEIKESFQTALPQEKNIVNPLAQLDQRLQSLKKEYVLFGSISGAGPLEVLHAITANTPAEMKISFDEMLITTETVRLTGTTESFDTVYKWQRLLQDAPQFSIVDVVGNPQREPDSELIRFTVLASFAAREEK